jgi:2-methylcitrate dehydratase PrpD
MGIAYKLAEFVVQKKFEDLPRNVVHDTKRLVLDALGCALGGQKIKYVSEKIINVIKAIGGNPESSIIGVRKKVSAPMAAYCNAKIGQLMDMDDVFLNFGHQCPMVFYPALAIAERQKASGKDFITAFALGYETGSRVVLGVGTLFDVVDGKVIETDVTSFGQGIFGGVAASGKLLKLKVEEMENAFGIAGLYTPAPLVTKGVVDMSMSKYNLELPAFGAVLGALLAKEGFEGPRTILDDHIYAKSLGKKSLEHSLIIKDLGEKWYIGETSIKPYPICRHNHYVVDLVDKIVRENDLDSEEIEQIVVKGLANYMKPPWNNYEPKNEFEFEFSVPCQVAVAAMRVPPSQWLYPGTFLAPNVVKLAKKVKFEVEPSIGKLILEKHPEPVLEIPTSVTVVSRGRLLDGKTRLARGDGFSEETRMNDEELKEKFRSNSSKVISDHKIEKVIERVFHLEDVKDVWELSLLLH